MSIAVAMALALTAVVGVASASASVARFESPISETTMKGSRVGANHVLSLGGDSFSCKNVSFSGLMVGKVVEQVTVTPELAGCTWAGLSVSWAMNGCKFRLNANGGLDIVGCEKPMTFNSGSCKKEIGNQNGIGTFQYTPSVQEGYEVLTVVANLKEVTYTSTGAGCFGSAGTFSNGTYTGEWLMKGFYPKETEQVFITWKPAEGPPPVLKNFAAEEAPVSITGERYKDKGVSFFTFPGEGGVACQVHALKGESASATPTSITLTPSYKECSMGTNASVSMRGCSYVLHASGEFDIVGANCATNPITVSNGACTLTVGPQSGLSGLTYANEGFGKSRSLISGGEAKGIKYTESGLGCLGILGTHSDGIYKSKDKFTATNSGGKQQGFWGQ